MAIAAVIWDLGGVLLRTDDPCARQALADRLGISRNDLEDLVFNGDSGDRAQLGEISVAEHWENIRQILRLDENGLVEFQRQFWGGDRLDEQLVAYIRNLRGKYRTALLSNAFSDLRQYVTDRLKILDAFDELIISSEVHLVKPDPRIYQYALQRLGLAPRQAVFIDDLQCNVEGARRSGLHAIHFRQPAQARAELEQLLNGGGE